MLLLLLLLVVARFVRVRREAGQAAGQMWVVVGALQGVREGGCPQASSVGRPKLGNEGAKPHVLNALGLAQGAWSRACDAKK